MRSVASKVRPQFSHWSPRASRVAAVGAGALHVAIGKESLGFRVEELGSGLLGEVAMLEEAQEDVLGHRVVVGGAGRGVQVP